MKIKLLTIFMVCYLLLVINSTAMASCKGNPPGDCYRCEGGVWVKYGDCLNDGDCSSGCEACAYCWCQIFCDPVDCIICMDDSCQCSEVVLSCFYDDCCVVVGNDYEFSATGIPSQCTPYLVWNAPGGDPSYEEGGGIFRTHWDTPGEKTVTVTTPCGSYDEVTVHVCDPATEECCYGCYDPDVKKCCPDTIPFYLCDINQTCCEGSCCDPNKVCCDGTCCDPNQVCCDGTCCDPNQVCCDGECVEKCETIELNYQCSTDDNQECIGCTVYPYSCSDFKMREYTGNVTTWCTGGCPDDCVQTDAVECYIEYECKEGDSLLMHACGVAPDPNGPILCGGDIEGGGGDGVACVPLPLDCMLWTCSPCVKNPDKWEVEYVYPKACWWDIIW